MGDGVVVTSPSGIGAGVAGSGARQVGSRWRGSSAIRKLLAARRKTLCDITNLRRPLAAEEGSR
jgi:hypothetical protein